MAEFKNNFMRSKMNKDLDDRLMPAGEYRDALNVSINKSQGDGQGEGNVGTLQTVLGNKLITSLTLSNLNNFSASPSNAEVIGILPSDANNSVYAFLTNNTLTQNKRLIFQTELWALQVHILIFNFKHYNRFFNFSGSWLYSKRSVCNN